jgi:DMSO reductase anchor subunit
LSTSWLSREIVALGTFVGLLLACAVARLLLPAAPEAITFAATLSGMLVVYCSAKVYEDTPRPYWASGRTLARFLLSSCASGAVLLVAVRTATSAFEPVTAAAALAAIAAKLCFELAEERYLVTGISYAAGGQPDTGCQIPDTVLASDSALLLNGALKGLRTWRFAIAALSGVALLAAFVAPAFALPAAAAWISGEAIERHLFFRAAIAPRMP